jgi:hypothetical protein
MNFISQWLEGRRRRQAEKVERKQALIQKLMETYPELPLWVAHAYYSDNLTMMASATKIVHGLAVKRADEATLRRVVREELVRRDEERERRPEL